MGDLKVNIGNLSLKNPYLKAAILFVYFGGKVRLYLQRKAAY